MYYNEFQEFCISLLPEISSIVKKYFRQKLIVDFKDDNSPVTIADKKIEELIREKIFNQFAGHSICGEEFGVDAKNSPYEWIIDPIDGTKSFISGVPLFASLIGLVKDEVPIFGCIYNPVLNDLVFGDNDQCTVNGSQSKIRDCKELSNAVVVSTDHLKLEKYRSKQGFENLTSRCRFYRSWGDAYGYTLIAEGSVDVMVDPKMSKWDILPVIPIMRGAGAEITDYYGNDPKKGDSIVVSHPKFHKEIIHLLNP